MTSSKRNFEASERYRCGCEKSERARETAQKGGDFLRLPIFLLDSTSIPSAYTMHMCVHICAVDFLLQMPCESSSVKNNLLENCRACVERAAYFLSPPLALSSSTVIAAGNARVGKKEAKQREEETERTLYARRRGAEGAPSPCRPVPLVTSRRTTRTLPFLSV